MAPSAIYVECASQEFSLSICNPGVVRGHPAGQPIRTGAVDFARDPLARPGHGVTGLSAEPGHRSLVESLERGASPGGPESDGNPGQGQAAAPLSRGRGKRGLFPGPLQHPAQAGPQDHRRGCGVLAVPVYWNGKPLCAADPLRGSPCEIYCLGDGVALRPAGPARWQVGPRLPLGPPRRSRVQTRLICGASPPKGPVLVNWAAALQAQPTDQPSVLHPVKHGVMLDPVPLTRVPGRVVISAVPDLAVSLSQFSRLEDEKLEAHRQSLLKQCREQMESLLREKPQKLCGETGKATQAFLTAGVAACVIKLPWTTPALLGLAAWHQLRLSQAEFLFVLLRP